MSSNLLKTPLHDLHVSLGARMVDFAGYSMPVQYAGVLAESKAVRDRFGIFDVSHMARFDITGSESFDFLQKLVTNDLAKLTDLKGLYSLLCNPEGGSIDDIIVYRVREDSYHLVANASNHAKVGGWLVKHKPDNVAILDRTDKTFMIAVQGPLAVDAVSKVFSKGEELTASSMFGVTVGLIGKVECFIGRSGYTGEDGVEIIGPAEYANDIWNALLNQGATNCGLASRDTLRVEAGLPLYGHELNETMSPLCAGLGWAISKNKEFVGSPIISQVRQDGAPLKLVGIKLGAKRLLTPGAKVRINNQEVGYISSGVISPLLDCGIGFAFVESSSQLLPSPAVDGAGHKLASEDNTCEVMIRDSWEPATIVNKRFFVRVKATGS